MSAPSIAQSYVDMFADDVRFAFQQRGSKLRSTVMVNPMAAENGYFEYIKPVEAVQRTGRAEELVPVNTEHERRRVSVKTFVLPDYIDQFDQALIKPEMRSAYVSNIVYGLGRKWDKLVIDAAIGTAYSGRNGETPVTLPSDQQIAVGTTNITLAKMREALAKLVGAEALPDDASANINLLYTANQLQALLKIAEDLKVDSLTTQSLANGKPNVVFMGMNLIRVNSALLPKTGNNRTLVAYVRDAIQYCEVKAPSVSVDWVPTHESWLVNGKMQGDAARVREDGVVTIVCDETKGLA